MKNYFWKKVDAKIKILNYNYNIVQQYSKKKERKKRDQWASSQQVKTGWIMCFGNSFFLFAPCCYCAITVTWLRTEALRKRCLPRKVSHQDHTKAEKNIFQSFVDSYNRSQNMGDHFRNQVK